MTREEKEAIKLLNELYIRADITDEYGDMEDMQPYEEALEIVTKALEQEYCEDAVSRQAVLKTLDDMDNVLDDSRTIANYKELLKECYEVLTPVNPQMPIIDKIRAEIMSKDGLEDALEIIDKYREGSERE